MNVYDSSPLKKNELTVKTETSLCFKMRPSGSLYKIALVEITDNFSTIFHCQWHSCSYGCILLLSYPNGINSLNCDRLENPVAVGLTSSVRILLTLRFFPLSMLKTTCNEFSKRVSFQNATEITVFLISKCNSTRNGSRN